MAREIYPGVIVPDRLQTEQFLKSRAHQFLSTYSDVRYANWQTALAVATASYKGTMSNYQAQLKALADIDTAAGRSLAAMDSEMRKLKDAYTTTDEKQVQAAANAQGTADRFNAGQANAMKRAQYQAQAAAARAIYYKNNTPASLPPEVTRTAERTAGQTAANEQGNDIVRRGREWSSSSAQANNTEAVKDANTDGAAPILLNGIPLETDADAEAAINQVTSSPDAPNWGKQEKARFIKAIRNETARRKGGGNLDVPGAPGVTGVKPTAPNFDEQQAIKLRRLYELGGFQAVHTLLPPDVTEEQFLKDFELKQTAGLRGAAQAEYAATIANQERPEAPSYNVIDEARRIYSEGFEQNPYMARRQAIADSVGSLINDYKANGMTPEEARDKAFNDLINFQADAMAAATEARKNEASKGGRAIARIPPTSIVDVDPTIVQNQATVPAPVDNSAFFGNAPDLGPSLRDELEQLLAARAARTPNVVPPTTPVETAPIAPAPVDPRMPNGRSAYAPGVGGLPAPSSYDYRGAGQVAQSAPTRSDLENDARVTNRGATPSMTARGQAPAFPVAPPQTVQPTSSVAPKPLALGAYPVPQVPPMIGSPLLPMTRGESATGSIISHMDIPEQISQVSPKTTEAALDEKKPFTVVAVNGRTAYTYDPEFEVFRMTINSEGKPVTGQPPIYPSSPLWNDLLDLGLYRLAENPAPPAGPPKAPGGSPRQPAAKQPPVVNNEEQRLMELLVTGTELADKPMKLNRLLNNTPAGKLVTQLMAANKKARTSQTFLDLREEIYRAYKGKPQQIELAIELLAASFIRETKSAAEKAQTTETN